MHPGQLCLTLCDPMDYSLPGSFVHEIFQQEYWSGLLVPPLWDLPDSGTESMTPVCPELAGRFFTTSANFTVIIRVWEH